MTLEILAAALGLFAALKKQKQIKGIGRVKRRVYLELEAVQRYNVPLDVTFEELSSSDREYVELVGKQFGWKQSERSLELGKSYAEAYFSSLRRAYNAIAGVSGVGATHKVRNAQGNVILTWDDMLPVLEHVSTEVDMNQLERELAIRRRRLQRNGWGEDLKRLAVGDKYPPYGYYGSGYGNHKNRPLTDYWDKYNALMKRGFTESESARMAYNIPVIYG